MRRPRKPSAQFSTLWLVVEAGRFRVKESIVREASGNTNHFIFSRPDARKTIEDTLFHVASSALKKKGYRRIELEKRRTAGAP